MRLSPLRRFSLRVFLWLLPAIGLWHASVTTVLLPGLALPTGAALANWFPRERVRLEALADGRWLLHSRILLKKQPKHAKGRNVWSLRMESLDRLTLGFALLWTLLMAVPEAAKLKAWKLLAGSLLLAVPIGFLLWLRVVHRVGQLIAADDASWIFVMEGIYQLTHPYPSWAMTLLSFLVKLLDPL